ncbi:unnamed protein product [Owenia fusiformis]|uniref:DSBA-like thioredoxin domain-containing protein n=1 Tax=Owenia fusiformis TaxID=6347 RepID=A0A8S4NPN7_OWEFU|nr:unnamed protein product [Owenia fusiformis]
MKSVQDLYDFTVRWEPFLLRPQMPPEGVEKPPPQADSPRVNPRLKEAGAAVGIDFTGKCGRYPNTLQAHVLLEYAKETDGGSKQNDIAELLFQAYFTDGTYPDAKCLLDIAGKVGLDKNAVKDLLKYEGKVEEARQKARYWAQQAVSGVPCFFMNGVRTFSGAQDPDAFVNMFKKVAEKYPAKSEAV